MREILSSYVPGGTPNGHSSSMGLEAFLNLALVGREMRPVDDLGSIKILETWLQSHINSFLVLVDTAES